MWQLSVGIELHELFQKLTLEILAIPASSEAVEIFSMLHTMRKLKKPPYVAEKLGNFGL